MNRSAEYSCSRSSPRKNVGTCPVNDTVAVIVVPLMVTVDDGVTLIFAELLMAVTSALKKLFAKAAPPETLPFALAAATMGELLETVARAAASAAACSFALTIDAME